MNERGWMDRRASARLENVFACQRKAWPQGRRGRNVVQIGWGWGECLTWTQGLGDESTLGKGMSAYLGRVTFQGKRIRGVRLLERG